jgi:hypothetical protein
LIVCFYAKKRFNLLSSLNLGFALFVLFNFRSTTFTVTDVFLCPFCRKAGSSFFSISGKTSK